MRKAETFVSFGGRIDSVPGAAVDGETSGGVNSPILAEAMLVQLVAAARAVSAASAREPFEELVAQIIVDAAEAVSADRAAVWIERDETIEVVATTGLRAASVDRFQRVEVGPETPGEAILRRKTPVIWSTHTEAQRYFPTVTVDDLGSGYVSPLHVAGTFSGVLFVGWTPQHRHVRVAERVFLEGIAHCCALAVERYDLDHELRAADHDIVAVGDAFSLRLTSSDVQSIAWIAGEIDIADEHEFKHALWAVIGDNTRGRLILDLSEVDFLSVAAARLILNAREQVSPNQSIDIRHPSLAARRVLDLLTDDQSL